MYLKDKSSNSDVCQLIKEYFREIEPAWSILDLPLLSFWNNVKPRPTRLFDQGKHLIAKHVGFKEVKVREGSFALVKLSLMILSQQNLTFL